MIAEFCNPLKLLYGDKKLMNKSVDKKTLKKEIVTITENGISYQILCNNSMEHKRANTLIGERQVLRFLKNEIGLKDVFYDIGANIGTHSIFVAKCSDNIKVHSFEPENKNCTALLENIKYNKLTNITTHRIALGEERKKGSLFLYNEISGEGRNSIIPIEGKNTQSIDVWDLDSYIQYKKLQLPNFIKIDVEGYELQVLNGMTATLQNAKPKLFIEIHADKLLQQFGNTNIVKEFLITHNYEVTDLNVLQRKGQPFIYATPKF